MGLLSSFSICLSLCTELVFCLYQYLLIFNFILVLVTRRKNYTLFAESLLTLFVAFLYLLSQRTFLKILYYLSGIMTYYVILFLRSESFFDLDIQYSKKHSEIWNLLWLRNTQFVKSVSKHDVNCLLSSSYFKTNLEDSIF